MAPRQDYLSLVTLLVRNYDEAIRFYVDKLGFELIEDTDLGDGKRWVRVRPSASRSDSPSTQAPGSSRASVTHHPPGADLLLARAATPQQLARVGDQTGGRVFLFIETDDLARDHARMNAAGVRFHGEPRREPYGTVAVFEDLYGNKFDLIQSAPQSD